MLKCLTRFVQKITPTLYTHYIEGMVIMGFREALMTRTRVGETKYVYESTKQRCHVVAYRTGNVITITVTLPPDSEY